jgi:hypothetical protein
MQQLLAQQKEKNGAKSNSNNEGNNNSSGGSSRPNKVRKIYDTLTTTSVTSYNKNNNKIKLIRNGNTVGGKRKRPLTNTSIKSTASVRFNNTRKSSVTQTKIIGNDSNQQRLNHQTKNSSTFPAKNCNMLPKPYASLFDMALAIDLGLMSVRSRHEYCSIDQVRSAVELSCQRSFTERDFAKVAFLFPGAYTWKYLRNVSNSNGKAKSVLHIRMDKRCGGIQTKESSKNATKESSTNVGDKILRNRRSILFEIIKRAATQKIEVVPILLEKMQEKTGSGTNKSEHSNLSSSRLRKTHRIGRLKISDVLSTSEESIVKHRKKETREEIQRREQALTMGILPTMCRALYTEFNMKDKNVLIVDDKFLSKIACSIRGTISKERVKGLLSTLASRVPSWCTLTTIGTKINRPRVVLRINRSPNEFLKCLNTLLK